jgi:hypothetical protein
LNSSHITITIFLLWCLAGFSLRLLFRTFLFIYCLFVCLFFITWTSVWKFRYSQEEDHQSRLIFFYRMLYENLYSYYSSYEDREFLRHMEDFQQPPTSNALCYYNRKKDLTSSKCSLFNSSISNDSSTSSSTSDSPISKKIMPSNLDNLSFCHTIYITINKSGTMPSSSSSLDYTHSSSGDSQLLVLPDICCTIPASKLSSIRTDWISTLPIYSFLSLIFAWDSISFDCIIPYHQFS